MTSSETDMFISLSTPSPISVDSENKDANDAALDFVSHEVKDVPISGAGNIETTQTPGVGDIETTQTPGIGDIETISSKEIEVDFSNASATSDTSDTSSLPQPVSSSDAPTELNAITCSTTAVTSAESMAQDPPQDEKSTSPPAPLPTSALPMPSIPTNDLAPMDIDAGKNRTESIVNKGSMQVDIGNHQKGKSSSTDMAVIAPPAWLSALNMDVYLQGCSDTTAWQELIESLYKFEKLNTINGVRRCDFIMGCY